MREIKFRAWDGKAMYIVREMAWLNGGLEAADGGSTRGFDSVMQLTGLRDKNGKEIYEGDILKTECSDRSTMTEEVSWCEGGFSPFIDDMCTASFHVIAYEVIGNIHENPELLK